MEPVVAAGIIANILSSVGLVLSNKFIWTRYEYDFVIALSFLHFLTTALATRFLLHWNLFEFKPASLAGVLPVSIGTLGSVMFMNLNLSKNSVGFYQVSKLACVPATLIMQYALYRKNVSYRTRLALLVILLGVAISTVAEVSINAVGFVLAIIAVAFTAQGQIFTASSQQHMALDSMQLLYHTSPQIALGMFVCIFLFEDGAAIVNFEYSILLSILIVMTCLLAVSVNISNYLVIGKTSPITYQVVGYAKTCLVLILGFMIFSQPITWRSILGIVTAQSGVMWYGQIKMAESKVAPLPQYSPVPKPVS